MKYKAFILTIASAASVAMGGAIEQFNELGYGTLSGRLQTLSMHRDYEDATPRTGHGSTLGLELRYRSPEFEGWSLGATYNGAGVLNSKDYDTSPNPGEALIANGRVNVMNEAYLAYNMQAFDLTNTTAYLGRRINNGEVFRADDFRQKSRSIAAFSVESQDVNNFKITAGHAWELSNWIDAGDQWKFENFDNRNIDGITWAETVWTGIEKLELAAFDAIAWDRANLLGGRARYAIGDDTALLGYARLENNIGNGANQDAFATGLSIEQVFDALKLEGGYFGVYGDDLLFQETSTGINHALGSSMMIYAQHFAGDSHTFYAKTTTMVEATKTKLYGLYNLTIHNQGNIRSGQEINVVAKQPIPQIDNLSVALKLGLGYLDNKNGTQDTVGTDTRLFLTYMF